MHSYSQILKLALLQNTFVPLEIMFTVLLYTPNCTGTHDIVLVLIRRNLYMYSYSILIHRFWIWCYCKMWYLCSQESHTCTHIYSRGNTLVLVLMILSVLLLMVRNFYMYMYAQKLVLIQTFVLVLMESMCTLYICIQYCL